MNKLYRKLEDAPAAGPLRSLIGKLSAMADPIQRLTLQPCPNSRAGDDCRGLTILSANLWHDWPRHRRIRDRLEDFAQLVEAEGADVVLLQEVARISEWRADEWLADRLGMASLYSRANGHVGEMGFEEGLALLSRFPIHTPRLRQLGGVEPFVRRLGLGATIESSCGKFVMFSVHLGLGGRENALQFERLQAWVADESGELPALVGGDFNAHETTRQISRAQSLWLDTYRHRNPRGDGTTHELRWPWGAPLRRARLDYIFLKPGAPRWQVLDSRHLETPGAPHSDHRAVMARLAPVPTG